MCTDASRQGLGFVMQQQTAEGQWILVQAGSHCLTDAESKYAVVVLELATCCDVGNLGMQSISHGNAAF